MPVITQAAPTTMACSYRRSIEALKTHPDYDHTDEAMVKDWENGHTSAARIANQLRTAGYQTSATIIKDHRRGECACRVDI